MSLRELFSVSRRSENPLIELEKALLDPDVRRSSADIEALLHADFSETGSSGEVYDRDKMIEMMLGQTPARVVIRDFQTSFLSDEVALVTYRSVGASGNEAHRSSVWVWEGETWKLRHHQGTRVPDRWGRAS